MIPKHIFCQCMKPWAICASKKNSYKLDVRDLINTNNLFFPYLNKTHLNYDFINRNPSTIYRDLPHYIGNDCDNGLFNLCLSKHKDINYSIYPDETNVYIGDLQVRHANVDIRTVNFDILNDKPFQCRNITPKFGYK